MTDFERDAFRMFGRKPTVLEIIRHHQILYMYCWRKVTDKCKLSFIYKLILKHLRKHYHIEIPYTCKLGGGFFMEHAFNITLNSRCIVGENVTIYKGATIGSTPKGVPVVGNNVYIGLNSTIVGDIIIGNDVLIAPNSYVNCSIPDHSIVLGNPCTIHKRERATDQYILNKA